ncbi:hypothetical protein AB0J86_03270 [Micromonospora sp. NPDC049559]|uniref:hypothetical protein n=1 Tax=Micromonospora sp. NPDC049559 TaxID=3155923 RepID=UPI00341DA333
MIDIARWLLHDAEPGQWTRPDVEAMCATRDWTLDGDGDAVVVRTGLPTGDGVLRRAPDGDRYIGLSIPLSGPHASAAEASDAFRRGGLRLHKPEALGESTALGQSIAVDDWFEPRSPWGTPFRQWRREDRLLDLRFEGALVAIALQPRKVVEERRYERFVSTTPHRASGFFLARGGANSGLDLPGGWLVDDWEILRDQLARMLTDLPTVTAALGTTVSFRLFLGPTTGTTAFVDVLSRDRLVVYGTLDLVPEPAALGWQPAEGEPDHTLGWRPFILGRLPDWYASGGGPGMVEGDRLADLIVETALAAGTARPDKAIVEFLWRPERFYPKMYGLSLDE